MLTRRSFFGGVLASASLGALGLSPGRPTRFGVVSDTHVTGPECADGLRRALARFRDEGVDAVLHCGDVTDQGRCDQMDVFMSVWNEVMPRGVELVIAFGNRDLADSGRIDKRLLAEAPEHFLVGTDRAFGVRARFVGAVPVVAADWKHEGELEDFLAIRPELRDAERPLVVLQHPHPQETVFGAQDWMADDGRAGSCLKMYPRALSFSGHSHAPFSEKGSVWEGEFAALAAGSFYLGPGTAKGGQEISILDVSDSEAVLRRVDLVSGAESVWRWTFPPTRTLPAKCPDEFTFVQWNIGNFSHGRTGTSAIAAADAAVRAAAYRRAIGEFGADIVGLNEFNPSFDSSGGDARKLLFPEFPSAVVGPHEGYQGNAVISRRPLVERTRIDYAERRQKTYALVCETEWDGKRLVIVETHLDLDRAARAFQIGELVRRFAAEERIVVSGDFNVSSASEFEPFVRAGFHAANAGAFGVIPTHRRRKFVLTPAIDNVFVKGLHLVGVRDADPRLEFSDHRPLVCRLSPHPCRVKN